MMPQRRRLRAAFTLVELLVVIGIIAVLISILLPVINKSREQGVTVKCMSNLRQIYIGLNAYAAENRGSMPWGWIWENPGWNEKTNYQFTRPGTASRATNWASSLSKFLNVRRPEGAIAVNYDTYTYYDAYAEALRCPALDSRFAQIVSYYPLMTAMPDYLGETTPGAYGLSGSAGTHPSKMIRPAKFSDLYPDNTLVWDTPGWDALTRAHAYEIAEGSIINGGTVSSYIDGGALMYPNLKELRYRDSKAGDPYRGIDPYVEQGAPILIFTKAAYERTNADVSGNKIQFGQSGTPRFRHNGDRACNALLGDGSVKTFVADFKAPAKKGKFYNDADYLETEWLRKYIMIRYP